jgi:hypothetical protein
MPKPPPRDQHGKIVPHDHPDILDDHYLIRHTTPQDLCDDDGGKRLSSGAFSESKDAGMSVDIEEWMKVDGLDPLHYITDPTHGAVRLKVGDLRRPDGPWSGQFSLGFRGFCRRHANLRDATNRQIRPPKPFRLFPTEPARFGSAWKSSSHFKYLKIWPTEPSAADLSATKTN